MLLTDVRKNVLNAAETSCGKMDTLTKALANQINILSSYNSNDEHLKNEQNL